MLRLKASIHTALCAAGAALAVSGSLYAQTPAPATDNSSVMQEVIVTGSRIPVPANITATSPISVVTDQEIKLQGFTDTIDVLNNLPQNIISGGVDFGNQSNPLTATGGVATVDLRGLGPQRTLVLVNGKRLGNGDPSTTNPNPAPDIDQIPAPLIERIDVVTGGASATYGSDAIAGVVNFILKKDFQGIQIDGQYGLAQHSDHDGYIDSLLANPDPNTGWAGVTPPSGSVRDGYKHDISIIMGTNFADGAGNVTGYFVYHDQQAVPGAARDFSDCEEVSNGLTGAVPVTNGVECVGSSNSNKFTPQGVLVAGNPTLQPGGTGVGTRYTVVGNNFLVWPQPGSVPPAIFDFNNYEYLQREDKRYTAGFMAHDDLNDYVKPYVEFNFMDDFSTAVVAPSGAFSGGYPFTADSNYLVNCSNALLSAQQQSVLCTPAQIAADKAAPGTVNADVDIGRRNIEGGGRTSLYEHSNFRVVTGVQGSPLEGFTYDAYASYYYVSAYANNTNYLNYTSIGDALQVTTNAAGQAVCISGGSCVPWNIFKTGGVTAAQLAYLSTPGTSDGNNTEEIEHIDITGDLGKYGIQSPWAKDGVGINFGGEHRSEAVTFNPDGAELAGDLAGFSGASVPTNAGYGVSEAFVEARVPIAQNMPGIYDLTTDAGYRYSDYSTAGVTNTYKFEVQYAPIQDGRMRFSFDRAVRAPNLVELYNAASIGQEEAVGTDPCAPVLNGTSGYTPATATLAACEHTGVTAAQYGNGATVTGNQAYTGTINQCTAGQCSQITEGNVHLKPEVATTWSYGLTFTPTEIRGLTASVDYYHIRLEGIVGSIPIANILNGCLQDGNPVYCAQIDRNGSGSLTGASVANGGYFIQQDLNLGTSIVAGVDVAANYRYQIPNGLGIFSVSFNGAYVEHNTTTPYPGAPTYDCAGLFGSTCDQGSVNPRWRHNMRFTWDTPWNFLLSAQWRFIGPTSFDNNSSNPLLANLEEGAYDPYNARIPGYNYLDLSAVWHAAQGIDVRLGVNNVLDKDPPTIPEDDITGTSGAENSYATYDLLGRELYLAFTAKF